MPDFSCGDCEQAIFPPYIDSICDWRKSRITGIFFTACDTTVDAITDLTEVQALITARKAVYIKVEGEKPDSQTNTVDNPFPCGPTQIIVDYSESINWSTPFNPANEVFWNTLRQNQGRVGEFYYIRESGNIFKAQGTPSTSVLDGSLADGNVHTVKGTFTWKASDRDAVYPALDLFRCTSV